MAGCCKLQVTCNGYAPLCTVIKAPPLRHNAPYRLIRPIFRVSDSLISQTVSDTQDSFGQSNGQKMTNERPEGVVRV